MSNTQVGVSSYLQWSDKGRSTPWRYIAGLAILTALVPALTALSDWVTSGIDQSSSGSVAAFTAAATAVFAGPFVALPVVTRLIHRRPWWSIGWPTRHFALADLGVGFVTGIVIGAALMGVAGATQILDLDVVVVDWRPWSLLVAVGLVGIFVQAATEEMLFRGYLTQFARRLVKNPVFFLVAPALLFAAPHIPNIASFGASPFAMAPYLVSGLLYGWAAWRTGSLSLAIGLHWSNNLGGLVLFGTRDDVLQTGAPVQFDAPSLLLTTALVLCQSLLTALVVEWYCRSKKSKRECTLEPDLQR